jgi:hypothetical protein
MVAAPMVITPGGQTFAPGQTQSTNTNANPNAQTQFVGADSVPFSALGNPSSPTKITVTFPNLPKRNLGPNPLTPLYASADNQSLQVGPNGYLLLLCFIQGSPGAAGTVVTATPQAITKTGTIVTGPHLGSENFLTFQAVVTIANSPLTQQVSGTVGAHLVQAQG